MPRQKSAPDPNATKLEWGKIIVPALIGLAGVIITTICGFVTTLVVTVLPSSPLSIRLGAATATAVHTATAPPGALPAFTQAIPTKDLPTISFELLDFNIFLNTNLVIYGKWQGEEYLGIIPEECFSLYVPNDPTPVVIERDEEVPLRYNFIVLSDKPIIISDISLYLDRYDPPPDPNALAEAVYVWGRGGGEVTTFALKNVNVGSGFKHASLNGGKAYRLENEDALAFSTTIYFIEPGEYKLHIELQAETFTGDRFAYSSQPLGFSWLYMNDLSSIRVIDQGTDEEMRTENPPCPK